MENGVVLKGGGDNMLFAAALADAGGGDEGLIIGLAAAGGKGELPWRTAKTVCHGLPGALQHPGGLPPHAVQTGGIAEAALQIRQHGVNGSVAHFCGGGVVRVNGHRAVSFTEIFPRAKGNTLPAADCRRAVLPFTQ